MSAFDDEPKIVGLSLKGVDNIRRDLSGYRKSAWRNNDQDGRAASRIVDEFDNIIDEAIKSGDLQKANVASQNLAKFQEGLKRETQREEAQQRQAIVQEQGRQERLTEKTKASVKASEEKTAAAKPMTTKEYLQGVNDINKNKNLPSEGRGFFFGLGPRTDITPTSHEGAIEQFHASAILNGEPTVQKAAKQNLLRLVKTRLGLLGKAPNAADITRLDAALQQYGLTREDLK